MICTYICIFGYVTLLQLDWTVAMDFIYNFHGLSAYHVFHFHFQELFFSKVEASDGTEAFNLLVAAVNSADERVRFNFSSPLELFCIRIIEGLTLQTARDPFLKKNYANLRQKTFGEIWFFFCSFFLKPKLRKKIITLGGSDLQ